MNWDGIFFDVVANAILDRVLHHPHVTAISGKSYRLTDRILGASKNVPQRRIEHKEER